MSSLPEIDTRTIPRAFDTERLHIRCPNPDDDDQVYDAIHETLEDLQRWMPWAREIVNIEDIRAWAEEVQAKFLRNNDLPLLLFLREDPDILVGVSGLHSINWKVRSCQIGYWVRRGYSGKGYITEAVNGITMFAFKALKMGRLEIQCDKENERSQLIPLRCGFRLETTSQSVEGTAKNNMLLFVKMA